MRVFSLLLIPMMVARLFAGIPEVLSYQKISSPHHEVPNPVAGWNVYDGQLLFTNRYLVVYEPQIPDSHGIVQSWGYIEVFDRLTFTKSGEIHPNESTANNRWGTSLAIGGDYIAVGSSGTEKKTGVDVYDLKTCRPSYHLNPPKGSSGNGYGSLLKVIGSRLLVLATDSVSIYDLTTGKRQGIQPLTSWYSGKSASKRFVMYAEQPDEWGYGKATQVLDLLKPKNPLWIQDLSFLDPDSSSMEVKCFDKRLFLVEPKTGYVKIHGYDLETRTRLFTRRDHQDDGYGSAAWKDRLFVPDPYSSPNGRVVVRDFKTGKITSVITPKLKSKDQRFGSRIACIRNTLFISSDKAWYAYDPQTLKQLYRADDQGWNLDHAEPVPTTGSDRIGFVFNFGKYDGFLFNSYYYNPQVMLLDPGSGQFTHRLNLEDAIIMSGFSPPTEFGRSLYAAGQDSVAVERPGTGGDYKIFSLSPSAGVIQQKPVASLLYPSTLGYGFEIRKAGTDTPLQTIPFGSGKTTDADIPYSDFTSGTRYELIRSQQFRLKDDYDILSENLTTLPGGEATNIKVFGNLAVVSVPQYSSPRTSSGAVFVLDMTQNKIVRTIQSPDPQFNEQFGSTMDLDNNRVAVGSKTGTYVYNIETGEMLGKFPAASKAVISGNFLVRSYYDNEYVGSAWVYYWRVTVYDLSTGKPLYTGPKISKYDATSIKAGSTRMLLGPDVYDLATGQYQFTLSSPNPETDDNFPSAIAADGEIAAVAASGQGTAYLFDLTNGQYLRSCHIHDRPQGFTNYYVKDGGLSLDATTGTLCWLVPDTTATTAQGVHLFDIPTGQEIAKIVSPTHEETAWEFPSGTTTTTIESTYYMTAIVSLDGNHVVFSQKNQNGEISLGSLDATALREIPLVREIVPLAPNAYLEISVETRRDTTYQIYAGPSAAQASDTGISFKGTGDTVIRRIPFPPNARSWVATVQLGWANTGAN